MWTTVFIYIVAIGLILAFGSLWWDIISRIMKK